MSGRAEEAKPPEVGQTPKVEIFAPMFCTDDAIRDSLQPEAQVVLDGRKESNIFYFLQLYGVIRGPVRIDTQGRLEHLSEDWQWMRYPRRAKLVVDHAGKATVSEASAEGNRADSETLTRIARGYREMLERGSVTNAAGPASTPVPFVFLGGQQHPVAVVVYDQVRFDMGKVQSGYGTNPSDMASLMYLELALIERDLGRRDYGRVLEEAIGKLAIAKKDFRRDVEFRQYLPESANFDRPECAILYLAGKCAEEQGEKTRALERYTTLIERSPGSPLAWEACARLMRLASTGTEVKRLQELEQMLVDTYPLIWGCPREGLKLDKTAVPNAVHGLLTRVADGIKK